MHVDFRGDTAREDLIVFCGVTATRRVGETERAAWMARAAASAMAAGGILMLLVVLKSNRVHAERLTAEARITRIACV